MDEVAPDIAVSEEQVDDVPLYHWYEYGVVPPDGLAVKVILCPESIVGLDGVIAPATSAGFIVKVEEYTELTVVGCESVTITLNCSGLFDVSALTVV